MSSVNGWEEFAYDKVFQKFAGAHDISNGESLMSRSQLKCALLYMYGNKPSDSDIDKLITTVKPHRDLSIEDEQNISLLEFKRIFEIVNDPYNGTVKFEPTSQFENYKQMFALLEDYENSSSEAKGFISLEDFKAAVRDHLPEAKYENLERIFLEIDSNKDDKVTYKDFIDLMKFKF